MSAVNRSGAVKLLGALVVGTGASAGEPAVGQEAKSARPNLDAVRASSDLR